jgi:hypothetical protein
MATTGLSRAVPQEWPFRCAVPYGLEVWPSAEPRAYWSVTHVTRASSSGQTGGICRVHFWEIEQYPDRAGVAVVVVPRGSADPHARGGLVQQLVCDPVGQACYHQAFSRVIAEPLDQQTTGGKMNYIVSLS